MGKSVPALTIAFSYLGSVAYVSVVEGREKRFVFVREPIDHARSYLATVSEQWDSALSRLKNFVEP